MTREEKWREVRRILQEIREDDPDMAELRERYDRAARRKEELLREAGRLRVIREALISEFAA